jgi:hypothetical protein
MLSSRIKVKFRKSMARRRGRQAETLVGIAPVNNLTVVV